jgi:predicted dehydrogenase
MKNAIKEIGHSSKSHSRRRFLRSMSVVGSSFVFVPRYVLGGNRHTTPSEKLNVAVVGTGGRGIQNIKSLIGHKDVRVMAVCDVTEEADYSRFYYGGKGGRGPAKELVDLRYSSDRTTEKYNECGIHIDFRTMLDTEKNIDAVVIATPDHTHAITALEAIRRGKHVYCEKPLARTIHETRMITDAAREAGVATQMGNQGHSGEEIRQTVEWIRNDCIGQVREVHAWCADFNRTGCRSRRPDDTPPVPPGMNWDLWIGPAPHRPYHPDYTPMAWRGWWDFGTGLLGDMGCHNMDPAFWALDLGHPTDVEARATGGGRETAPCSAVVYYQFPSRKNMPPVKMIWYSGLMPPRPDELELGQDLIGKGNGILFVGDKGKLMCPGWAGAPQLIPESRMKEYAEPPKTLPRSNGHHRDWIEACKGGSPSSADFDYAGPMTEVVLLGNVAIRAGEKLSWNSQNMSVVNCPDADQYIRPEYHNGWTL